MNLNDINKKDAFRLFNQYYFELLNMMKKYSEKSMEFKKFYTYNYMLKKTNIKLFIRTWNETITKLYFNEIINGNIEYFLNKDYSQDMRGNEDFVKTYNINTYIIYFKKIYNNLKKELVDIFVEKIQQLTSLSRIYFN